jgi:tryptophanyl-tRNA synthetase
VPVGEDQIPHIEFTREIARRFNHIYGKEKGFEEKAEAAIKKLGNKRGSLYEEMRVAYQQSGDEEALESARAMIEEQQGMSIGDKERLLGYLEGGGKMILLEPDYKLTPASKMPGLDGQKMSKSYNNTISLREDVDSVAKKIKTMPTDPARVRRTDPGDPAKCPVWQLHQIYSSPATQEWVQTSCKSAAIGCIECKGPVIEGVLAELKPIQERAAQYAEDPTLVKNIVAEGCEKARKLARETMRDVREVMGLNYN